MERIYKSCHGFVDFIIKQRVGHTRDINPTHDGKNVSFCWNLMKNKHTEATYMN